MTSKASAIAQGAAIAEFEAALQLVSSQSWQQAVTRAQYVKACGGNVKASARLESDHGTKIAPATFGAWARVGRLIESGQVKPSTDKRADSQGIRDLASAVTVTGGGPALSAALKATKATRTASGLAAQVKATMEAKSGKDAASRRQGPDRLKSLGGSVATLADNDPDAIDDILAKVKAAALERIAERTAE